MKIYRRVVGIYQGDGVTDDSAKETSKNILNNCIKTIEKRATYTMSENMDVSDRLNFSSSVIS